MSQIDEQTINSTIKNVFLNKSLTGFDIARHNQITNMVKRDSTQFAIEIIHHDRGREIVCELIDVALRPRILLKYIQNQNKDVDQEQLNEKNAKSPKQTQKQMTNIIYNAVQILTNQYEEFVQFIFQDPNEQLIESGEFKETSKIKSAFYGTDSIRLSSQENKQQTKMDEEDEDWQDCVIMDSGFPELTRNEQDQLLNKIQSFSRLNQFDMFKSLILDRMFLLFSEPIPVEQTPVSYFNKIILQFVYQKPEEVIIDLTKILRYFFCEQKHNNKKSSQSCPKIRKITRHLYNNCVGELFVHIMQLESEGNFFSIQKIQILKTITEEVFKLDQPKVKSQHKLVQINNNAMETEEEVSTVSEIIEDRISNFNLLLKTLYEKLDERYEQEKYLQIFKYFLNDEKLLANVILFFQKNFNLFDVNGLIPLLVLFLKMDQANFRSNKATTQSSSPFGGHANFSFQNKEQESSIASYDLKLSKQILDLIQKVLTRLIDEYKKKQQKTIKMIEYYEFIHCWLNVTVGDRQSYAYKYLLTPDFINQCLFKIKQNEKSTILHNAIKNVLVDFLPKINDSINIILASECQLLGFIQNYLEGQTQTNKKKKRKCFQNQLYHIGKTVLSIWQQQKILNIIKKTQNDQSELTQQKQTKRKNSVSIDTETIARFQNLKNIVEQKQKFYEHLICGDPRKVGEYHEDQSSEIIPASSFKNFFKSINNNENQEQVDENKHLSKDRYADNDEDQEKSSKISKLDDDLKKQTNLKTDPKFRNLRIGDDMNNTNSLFESAISPLNANRSHTFNFQFDALPLDSDNEVISEEEDFPLRETSAQKDDEQVKLMQQNIENFDMMKGGLLGMGSNLFSQNQSIQKNNNLLSCDNYRKDELSKSLQIPDMNIESIEKVDSYMQIDSPRKHSEDEILSLGLDSNQGSGSKRSDENPALKLLSLIQSVPSFLREEINQNSIKIQPISKENNDLLETVHSNYVKHYSSYLKYDVQKLAKEVE